MTDDLVKLLRNVSEESMYAAPFTTKTLINAAADRIEALEEALREIAQHDLQAIALDALRPGERAALAGEKKDG